MKNQFKLEIAALGLFSILLLLARIDILPNFVHLFYAVFLSAYFFPVRLVIKKDNDTSLIQVSKNAIEKAALNFPHLSFRHPW